tara:strand:- start:130 stop:456 length:327 start_codon:yes stop_codon:yes gene_type:complete
MADDAMKKIVFHDTDKRHADLKIRLHYDGFTQAGFFRAMISGYLNKDPAVIDFIQRVKEERNIQSIKKRKNSKRLLEAGEEVKSKFSIFKDGEVENIFDIIEKEFPDL